MKNLLRTALAVFLVLALFCGIGLAESSAPGIQFDNIWIAGDFTINAYNKTDENGTPDPQGGFTLEIEQIADAIEGTGYIWEVHGLYDASSNMIRAFSVLKWDAYTEDGIVREGSTIFYEDNDNQSTFSLDEDGQLIWYDSKENAGAGLTFVPIGRYEGLWPAVGGGAEILWSDDHYTVYIDIRNDQNQQESYIYTAFYDAATGRLDAFGTCDVITYDDKNQEISRAELNEDINAVLYINDNHDLVWENLAPQGVKTQIFQNQFNASLADDSNG